MRQMLSETKTSQAKRTEVRLPPIKIADDDIFKMDMDAFRAAERRLADRFRHELLEFATKNRTKRVYVVNVTKFEGTTSNFYYMPFAFENRSMAYSMRDSLKCGRIDIYDFSPIINSKRPLVREDEKKLWQAFNKCCRCDRYRPCKDGTYCGEPVRMCEDCVEELTSH